MQLEEIIDSIEFEIIDRLAAIGADSSYGNSDIANPNNP